MTEGGNGLDTLGGLQADMVTAVRYVLKLRLPRARWERIAEIIEVAIAAAAARDRDGLRTATDDLMLVSPLRIVKGDGPPAEPAGKKIFERANVLIYALEPMRPAPAEDNGKEGH
jgi:hypothetical protein